MEPPIRPARPDDAAFLGDMLREAMSWRPGSRKPTLDEVASSHYLAGWPRRGDVGVVAEIEEPVGAAWCRLLPSDDPGYGFADDDTPEVRIGVIRTWRQSSHVQVAWEPIRCEVPPSRQMSQGSRKVEREQ